jgi:hypothetical protein
MMKTLTSAVVTACFTCLVACGGEEPTEETAQNSEKLDLGCLRNARTSDELRACLNSGGGGAQPTPPAPPAGGGGQSCSTSVQCLNGVCKCGGGVANAGQVCDPTSNCNTLCRDCK